MARVVATFIGVWLAIAAIGILISATITPIPDRVVGLVGFTTAVIAAVLVRRGRLR